MSVVESLARIEAWLGEHGATLELAGPAPCGATVAAESTLGFALPADYAELLARHDGQRIERVSWLPGGGRLRAITDCAREWQSQQRSWEPDNPVVPEPKRARYYQLVFHPRWLPIGGNEHWDGDNVVLDMVPAANGHVGQVLGFVSECDVVLLGDSLAGFLARYVELIDACALACVAVADQDYAFQVVPADRAKRTVYQTRWDALFDPAKPVASPRGRHGRR